MAMLTSDGFLPEEPHTLSLLPDRDLAQIVGLLDAGSR